MSNISLIKRFNWQFTWKYHKRAVGLFLVLLAVAGYLELTQRYLEETIRRLVIEQKFVELKAERITLANLGAPGWVKTDWVEGTVDIEVRKPH